MNRKPWTAAVALAIALAPAGIVTPAHADDAAATIQFVLDASGSMAADDLAGRPKIDSAREALNKMTDSLDPAARVGMRVYGATVPVTDPNTPPSGACSDTQQVVAAGTNNRSQLHEAINRYKPTGYTPTVQALKAAADDLGKDGNRHIVLVSDGQANCSPDPCGEVKALRDSGVTIQVDAVGMSLDAPAREQLQCIAAATGGTYYDTTSTGDLTNSLQRITKRALRGYDFQGTPVTGTKVVGGPKLAPGQYLDKLPNKEARFYTVDVPAGRSLAVSATVKPLDNDSIATTNLKVELMNGANGCASGSGAAGVDVTGDENSVVSTAAVWDPVNESERRPVSTGCDGATQLNVKITRDSSESPDPTPVEIVVTQSDWPMDDLVTVPWRNGGKGFAHLPQPKDAGDRIAAPSPQPPTMSVVGGTSFSSAAELAAGATSDSAQIGESLVYKVKLDWGQSATLAVDSDGDHSATAEVRSYGRYRQEADGWDVEHGNVNQIGGDYRAGGAMAVGYVAPVAANNRFSTYDRLQSMSDPGYAYFVVNVQRTYGDRKSAGTTMPLRLNLRIDGKAGDGAPAAMGSAPATANPSSAPASTATKATKSPTATASAPSSQPEVTTSSEPQSKGDGFSAKLPIVIGGGALGLMLMGGGAAWLLLRRR